MIHVYCVGQYPMSGASDFGGVLFVSIANVARIMLVNYPSQMLNPYLRRLKTYSNTSWYPTIGKVNIRGLKPGGHQHQCHWRQDQHQLTCKSLLPQDYVRPSLDGSLPGTVEVRVFSVKN